MVNWALVVTAVVGLLGGGGVVAVLLVRATSRKLEADTEVGVASAAKVIAEGAQTLVVELRERIGELRGDVQRLIAAQELCDTNLRRAHELLADIKAEAADRLAAANLTTTELVRMRLVIEGLKEGRKVDREEVAVIREKLDEPPPPVRHLPNEVS